MVWSVSSKYSSNTSHQRVSLRPREPSLIEDGELASIKNEQKKKDEILAEAKLAKQDAIYRVSPCPLTLDPENGDMGNAC